MTKEINKSFSMSEAIDHKTRLEKARATNPQRLVKEAMVAAQGPIGALSLAKHVSLIGDLPIAVALMVAILKDILDLIGIGSLPAIGTVVTLCSSVTIGFMIFLASSGSITKAARNAVKRMLVWIGGTGIEMFGFGINFFPVETLMVLTIYYLILIERKIASQEEGALS